MKTLILLFSLSICAACTSSRATMQFQGYQLAYLGNMEPTFVTSEQPPVEHGKTFSEINGVSTGVWHCTQASWSWPEYPVHEIIEVLDGTIMMSWDKGRKSALISKGDYFYIPKGASLAWENQSPVLKKYVVLDDLPSALSNLKTVPHIVLDKTILEAVQSNYFNPIAPSHTR